MQPIEMKTVFAILDENFRPPAATGNRNARRVAVCAESIVAMRYRFVVIHKPAAYDAARQASPS
jgi:hypothetical protein